MKQSAIWVLLAANVALAGTLAMRGINSTTAHAQAARPADPGKYVMIPAESQLGVGLVFILDTGNRRLGAVAPDTQDKLAPMSTIELDPIFDSAGHRPAAPNDPRNRKPNAPR